MEEEAMKSKWIQYSMVSLSLSLSACGPSKETMCEQIAKYRSTPTDEEWEASERYVRCLNAPNDYAKTMYKEMKRGKENK